MASAGEVFCHRVDIRYMEVDSQGVVFNGWYLTYFDEAMAAFLRHRGLPYADLLVAGYDAQLVRTELEWKAGLRWGDDVCVAVATAHTGRTSFTLDFETRRDGHEITSTARTTYVVIATDGSGKQPIPPVLAAALGSPAPLHVDGASPGPRRQSVAVVTEATADLDHGDRRSGQ